MLELNFCTSKYKDWDSVFSQSSGIKVRTLKTGTIATRVSGLINLKNPAAAEIKEEKAVIPVLSHLITHPGFGDFLVDTGFCSRFQRTPGGSFKGIIKSLYFKKRYMAEEGEGIDIQLKNSSTGIKALFLTHAHEHGSGVYSLPADIIRVCGEGEEDEGIFPLVYSDYMKKFQFKKIDFSQAQEMPIVGKAADIFGDGSFWAVSTPGHTKGHISYLVNAAEGPILLMGDAGITERAFKLEVEPGTNSKDSVKTRESFLRLKEFVDTYPRIRVVFGHENEEYRIRYL